MGNTKKITAALVAASCLSLPQTAAADGFKYYDVGLGILGFSDGGLPNMTTGTLSAAYELAQWTFYTDASYSSNSTAASALYKIGAQYQFENNIYASVARLDGSDLIGATFAGVGYNGEQVFAYADVMIQSGVAPSYLTLVGYEFGDVSSSFGTTTVAVGSSFGNGSEAWLGYLDSDFGQFGLDIGYLSNSGDALTNIVGSYDVTDRLTLKAGVLDLGPLPLFYSAGVSYDVTDRVSLSAGAMDLPGGTAYSFDLNFSFQEKSLRDLGMLGINNAYFEGIVPLF